MSTTPSLPQTFQLPDVLGIVETLELSANPRCRAASDASAVFTSNLGLANLNSLLFPRQEDTEREKGREDDDHEDRIKLGLLVALMFPRADLAQLMVLTDFMQLLVWTCITGAHGDLPDDTNASAREEVGIDILQGHPYFKNLVSRLKRYPRSFSSTWKQGFEKSFKSFTETQQLIHSARSSTQPSDQMKKWMDAQYQPSKPRIGVKATRIADPGKGRDAALDEHLRFRRKIHGVDVLMHIAELVEVLPAFDELVEDAVVGPGEHQDVRGTGTLLSPAEMSLVREMKAHAVDFAGMAIDTLSFRYLHLNNLPNIRPSSSPGGAQVASEPTTSSLEHDSVLNTPNKININPYLPYTFIPHVMMHNSLSLQGAMNHSTAILTTEFKRFRESTDQNKALELMEKETDRVRRAKSGGAGWAIGEKVMGVMRLIGGSTSGEDLRGYARDDDEEQQDDPLHQRYLSSQAQQRRQSEVKAYIRVLEDLIVGCVNWAYESELLFGGGNKGGEVRAFGWVFG